ncbi:MAG: NAD(P)/FAD-dependent oxidoreductase [Candidatus Pacebacteria bacterium]|nr:NAD(P)/FAD-dependent oxidoreductase [Candidatus Paceibacterota bacterium]MBP9772488.1 NAD(P)/FAD-dependent oxidoreductase [Candidatus Paceibacterota bacterium]
MKSSEIYDCIVVGGGASGMMAAGVAAENGKRVLILEKNQSLGEKLKITGGGRCNITNAEEDLRTLLKSYDSSADFLFSPFSQFSNKDTFTFFEKLGLPIVVQARKRAFPESEKAYDVYQTLKKYIDRGKVEVRLGEAVLKIVRDGSGKNIASVKTKDGIYKAKSFIFATGGVSHPETGSTGDGFKWLRDLGHEVVNPTPTIVPLKVPEKWVHELAGVSMSFMKIIFYLDSKKQFSKTGKVLFTHFGLSGPLILNSSKKVSDLLHSGIVTAKIDAYPDTELGDLEKKIIKVFDANKNKALKNVFKDIVPPGMTKGLEMLFKDIDFDTKVHSITKEERKYIVQTLKALPVTISGLMGYDRAVVADGGVVLTEIDTKTMRSKLYNNLYLTGDLLHINRPSGGFSLQLCWTTGYVAGKNV